MTLCEITIRLLSEGYALPSAFHLLGNVTWVVHYLDTYNTWATELRGVWREPGPDVENMREAGRTCGSSKMCWPDVCFDFSGVRVGHKLHGGEATPGETATNPGPIEGVDGKKGLQEETTGGPLATCSHSYSARPHVRSSVDQAVFEKREHWQAFI